MTIKDLDEMYARSERLADAILDLEERDIPNTEYTLKSATVRLKYLKEKHDRMKTDYDTLNEEILKAEREEKLDKPILITELCNIFDLQLTNNFKQ